MRPGSAAAAGLPTHRSWQPAFLATYPARPHPQPVAAFYSGSMLKGLAGSCALTLLIAPLRNRLRFRSAQGAPAHDCVPRALSDARAPWRWRALLSACLACCALPLVQISRLLASHPSPITPSRHLAMLPAATTCWCSWPSSTCAA